MSDPGQDAAVTPRVAAPIGRDGGQGWWPATAGRAAAWYVVLTLVMTWPLAPGLTRDIPWDLGDSLLNCWILGWNADHVLRALGGDIGALRGILDANIFYPAPLTLAYSELLVAQTIQILPVYALTGNLILCYNLLFLSSFVLSGLGAYLLARHYTDDWRAAFVAGLVFAFVPYRWAQISHLQVISVQWMPFALYGFARWAASGSRRALAGATGALVAQNLSCGYFLIYFALFVPPFVIWSLARHGRLFDGRRWLALIAAAAATAAATVPFMLAYLQLRAMTASQRPMSEVVGYSADTLSYATANAMMRLWGGVIAALPRPEGDLFMGMVALLLTAAAVALAAKDGWQRSRGAVQDDRRWWMQGLRALAIVSVVTFGTAALLILVGAGGKYVIGPLVIRLTSFDRVARLTFVAALVLVATSARARRLLAVGWRSPTMAFVVMGAMAAWLSLGPVPQADGRLLGGLPIYAWLYEYVPGVDGLRVPARLAFVAALAIATLAGLGLAALARRRTAAAPWVCGVAGALVLAEGTVAPLPLNLSAPDRELAPPARVAPGSAPSALARWLDTLPEDAVLVEFPFGDVSWELQHVYRSTQHWRRLVNGYSGGFPLRYLSLRTYFDDPRRDPQAAAAALRGCGATHVVLHARAYSQAGAAEMEAWLLSSGARPVARIDQAVVFAIGR